MNFTKSRSSTNQGRARGGRGGVFPKRPEYNRNSVVASFTSINNVNRWRNRSSIQNNPQSESTNQIGESNGTSNLSKNKHFDNNKRHNPFDYNPIEKMGDSWSANPNKRPKRGLIDRTPNEGDEMLYFEPSEDLSNSTLFSVSSLGTLVLQDNTLIAIKTLIYFLFESCVY